MTVRMTKAQILKVNTEQGRTIHTLREECRHKQAVIDQLLHDKNEPPAKKHPSQMNAAELRAYVQSPDAQIAGLQEKVNYLNSLTWGPNSHETRLQLLEQRMVDLRAHVDGDAIKVEALERFKDQIDVADDIIAGRMQIMEERLNSLAKDYEGTCRTLREHNVTLPDNRTFKDDVVYKNAMRAMHMDVPPTISDVSFVQYGAKKYPKEVARSKQFGEWCVKWGKELFELLGGCK